MAGYVNPDGQIKRATKVFGNVDGSTVRAKSLWANRDGVATCIYRDGGITMHVVGMGADVGSGVFPMAYSYDMEVFRACSITMPSGYENRKPTSISELFYSKELNLFVALGWYVASSSSSTLYWYMLYSEDGKTWEVALAKSLTYSGVNFSMVYDESNHLFFMANKSQNPSSTTTRYYFYYSLDGKNWTELQAILPQGGNSYTSYDILKVLSPKDGYVYMSGIDWATFFENYDEYYPFIRTEDGVDFFYYNKALAFDDIEKLYGSRSLLYYKGKYYNLSTKMLSEDQNSIGINISSDGMDTWQYVSLDFDSSVKNFRGSERDGFFVINDELFCSISKSSTEAYLYKENLDGTWSKQSVKDSIFGKEYAYLYNPVSKENLYQIGNKFYRTHGSRLSSTEDGTEYLEESILAANMRAPFNLSSSTGYVIAMKNVS